MAFPNVVINRLSGQSGRPAAGFDYYSGLMLYGTAPTVTGKWTSYPASNGAPAIKAQQMFSAADAVSAGIIPFTDNTAPAAIYTLTTKGNTNDTLKITVDEPRPNGTVETIDLGTYTVQVADSTIALQTVAIAALINAGTINHGYSASSTSTTYTVTAPKKVGKSLNTDTPDNTITGAFVGSYTTAFTGGTASPYSLWEYHIRRFFIKYPTATLWVGIISASSSFLEIRTLQNAAGNKLRQLGVFDTDATRGSAANITGTILSVHNSAVGLDQEAPFSVSYQPNIFAVADLSTYPDQNLNIAFKVRTVLAQDGNAEGAQLFLSNGQTVGSVGSKLATLALSRISGSDAQATTDNNLSDGVEYNVPAFGNGQLSSAVSTGIQTQLNDYNYTFFRTWGDQLVGTYWNDNRTAITRSSDYAYENDVRTIDKVARIGRATMIPLLNAELIFNTDGTLQDYTIETFKEEIIDEVTAQMITGFGSLPLIGGIGVTIDPTQPVKITNNLNIDIVVIENGIARKITLNLGYGTTI